jgi:hypothetical protein
MNWREALKYDPLPALLTSGYDVIVFFAKRDLLGHDAGSVEQVWASEAVARLTRKQQVNGSWRYCGAKPGLLFQEDYDQLETYRIVGELVERYGLTRKHPSIPRAAEFLFSRQTPQGDFRGIYGRQYTPNYSAGILELLVKAGYEHDPRAEKTFQWLLSMRQNDGSWALPIRTVAVRLTHAVMRSQPIEPDRSKPSSHMVTGIVLRAFAADSAHRKSKEARAAGEFLASQLLKRDRYPDRGDASYWTKFTFPFWFTDLLSALDSLSLLGFTVQHPQIRKGLDWLISKQQPSGLWDAKRLKLSSDALSIALAICRVFRRFYGC